MKTIEEIKQLAIAIYGNDPNSFGQQRDGYLKGYQDAQEQYNWISVENSLPNEKERVLCFPRQHPFVMIRETDYEEFTNKNLEWFKEAFSHWQPLPNPPKLFPEHEDVFQDIANEHRRRGFITAVKGLEPILLFDFFMWFRENGEKHLDVSVEKMIEIYLNESSNN